MARLPSDVDLGGISSANSGRPIANIDTTGYARAAAAYGSGVSDLGKGINSAAGDISIANRHKQLEDDKLEIARARSDFLTKKVNLDSQFSTDTDHETLPDRYTSNLDVARREASAHIKKPRTRELFDLSVADDVARGTAGAKSTAQTLWKDATITDTGTRLEAVREAALKSTDPVERARLVQSGNDLITSLSEKGVYSKENAAKVRQEWTTKYAAGAIALLPPEDRVKALAGFEGALRQRESGGKPGVVNNLGYAGLYQFGAPRLSDTGLYTPGAGENVSDKKSAGGWSGQKWSGTFNVPGHPEVKTLKDFLGSPDAQQTAFGVHTKKMDEEIAANKFDQFIGRDVGRVKITREGLHAMLHLGGVGGTRDALNGKGNAADANGTTVLEYAKLGQQSDPSRIASILPEETRVRMLREGQSEIDRAAIKTAMERSETWERGIVDASAGIGSLPNRKDIETDPALDDPRRNTLLKQYDSAAGDVAGLNRFMTKFKDPNGGAFNPYDADEKKYIDKAYTALGGNAPALHAIVSRTGILPKAAVTSMRGALVSNDPAKVATALSMSSNLLNKNPNIFAGDAGTKDLETSAISFQHYVDTLGMSADEAAKSVIRDQSLEYQASVKARIKSENIDEKIKKEVSVADIEGGFDQRKWIPFTDPSVGFDPRTRLSMFTQFSELVKENYLDKGDMTLAKRHAIETLKKSWGVSNVNGKSVVMQFPPERAPVYQGVENVSELIANQAAEAIKAGVGYDIDRKTIKLQPIPGATAQAYKAGQPPPYMVMWEDKNGTVQMLSPGKAFIADPAAMKAAQSAERQAGFDQARAAQETVMTNRERSGAGRRNVLKAMNAETERLAKDKDKDEGPKASSDKQSSLLDSLRTTR